MTAERVAVRVRQLCRHDTRPRLEACGFELGPRDVARLSQHALVIAKADAL